MSSKLRLENKVAIVTGAGSRAAGIGNGRATAILFAREGAKVLLVDQSFAAAEETLATIIGKAAQQKFLPQMSPMPTTAANWWKEP